MLRGTVYVVDRDGAIVNKPTVMAFGVTNRIEFEAEAVKATPVLAGGPGARLEFGPISEPWRRV